MIEVHYKEYQSTEIHTKYQKVTKIHSTLDTKKLKSIQNTDSETKIYSDSDPNEITSTPDLVDLGNL